MRSLGMVVVCWLTLIVGLSHAVEVQTNIGSHEATQTLTATDPINCGTGARLRTVPVQGSGGPVDLIADPQIVAGAAAGQLCHICGAHDTNTVKIDDGTGVTLPLSLSMTLRLNECAVMEWTGTVWNYQRTVSARAESIPFTPSETVDATTVQTAIELASEGASLQHAYNVGTGGISGCSVIKPCQWSGSTLKYLAYEQGGNWIMEVRQVSDNALVSLHKDVPAGLTHQILGDGTPIVTYDGTAASQTHHKAPTFDDGIKVTFNPNATNAGLNLGSQAGDPSAVANGDMWYNSTSNKFRCRENGSNFDCIGAGGGGGITASSTDTLTNKTVDAEADGNIITIPRRIWIPAAGCNNATAGTAWDLPASNAAVAACVTGTNTQKGVLDFADGSNLSAQITHKLPSTWTGAIDVHIKWFSATASTNNVVWQVATSCVADGETDDPSFNTASTVTDAGKGTTLQTNDASITGVTTTGCALGELMHVKIQRDSGHASDTFAGTARLIGVELVIRELL